MALVTSTEVRAALTSLTTAQISEISTVIDVATALMESYCESFLDSKSTVELIEPGQSRTLRLSSGNVTSIQSIRAGSTVVLTVAGPGTADRATVTFDTSGDPPFTTATGLSLWSRTAGIDTTTDLSFATYATLASLADAINAVGGWHATVAGNYGTFATADLEPAAGPRGALLSGAALSAFAYDVDSYDLDAVAGVIRTDGPWCSDARRYPDRMWGSTPRYAQIRAAYTAGYSTVPDDLKRAAIIVCKGIYDTETVTGQFAQEKATLGQQTYYYSFSGVPDMIPPTAKNILDRKYKRYSLS